MPRTPLVLAALALVSASSGVAAGCVPSTSEPDLATPDAATPAGSSAYYVFEDLCPLAMACIGSVWVYQESNGIPGPQRGDEVKDDTCGRQIEPDEIVF